jgi:phenol 2-monooxygenase
MAAAWMATTGVKTIIVDQKPCRTLTGHADGLESRTLEILASFGLAEVVSSEANPTIEVCLWVSILTASQNCVMILICHNEGCLTSWWY